MLYSVRALSWEELSLFHSPLGSSKLWREQAQSRCCFKSHERRDGPAGGWGSVNCQIKAALRWGTEDKLLHWICIFRAYREMEWKMERRQPDVLLGRWELPNLFSGASAAVSQLLRSGLYFQGYCLIKEETLSLKGYLIPSAKLGSWKGQLWVEQSGLSTKCLRLRPFTFLTAWNTNYKN